MEPGPVVLGPGAAKLDTSPHDQEASVEENDEWSRDLLSTTKGIVPRWRPNLFSMGFGGTFPAQNKAAGEGATHLYFKWISLAANKGQV